MKATDPLPRFYSRIVKQEDGCWVWQGASVRGRGQLSVNGKNVLATRFSYTHFKGEIPEGMYVCHTCDDPSCVNPEHLWVGTARDNALDAIAKQRMPQSAKTNTCQRGHNFTGKHCKECQRLRDAKKRLRQKKEIETMQSRITELEREIAQRDADISYETACESIRRLRAESTIELEPGRSYKAAELLRIVIWRHRVRKGKSLWPAVMSMFGVDMTVAQYLCRWAGRDPDTGADLNAARAAREG